MLPEDKKTGFSIFKRYESLSGILLPFESGASLAFLIILLKGEHVLFFLGGLATKREGKFFSCVCWGRGGGDGEGVRICSQISLNQKSY